MGFRVFRPLLHSALICCNRVSGPSRLFQGMSVLDPDIRKLRSKIDSRFIGVRRIVPVMLITRCVATGDQGFGNAPLRRFSTE